MTPRKLSLIVALLLILCVLGAALFVFKGELGDQIIDAYNLYKTEVIYHAKDTKQPSKSFRKFKNQNKDVEYILNVPGTNINYPVVGDPKKDNSYYLHRGLDEKYSKLGTLYLDQNTPSGSQIKVVYGHKIAVAFIAGKVYKKAMFGQLDKFKSKKFRQKHITATLYDGKDTLYYNLCYGVITKGYGGIDYYSKSAFKSQKEYEQSVKTLARNALFEVGKGQYKFDIDDDILILSTCDNAVRNGRLVLYYKLVEPPSESETIAVLEK